MEIEKKFLVKYLPEDLEKYPYDKIEQGYLCGNPVLRIRKRNNEYILTYKSREGVEKAAGVCACIEEELALTEESFFHLKEKTDGIWIKKTRYQIPYEEFIIELDIFHEDYEGLVLAEVEFKSLTQSEKFIPPEWFGENVSDDMRYSNRVMSEEKIDFGF